MYYLVKKSVLKVFLHRFKEAEKLEKGVWGMPRHFVPKKDVKAAKSSGELLKSVEPEISEWGNP